MPRKARSYKRHKVNADYKYNNIKVAKFINYIMERGKKTVAARIVYDAFDIIADKLKSDPQAVFEQAVKNVSPILEVKGRRIGGANYQVPIEVMEPRKTTLAMRWIIEAAANKKGKRMAERLAEELMEAHNKLGVAIKKREDVHRMAEANKAFAHFARFQRR
ncbi:MAG: 30S ribosomal protein S7 [Candidatus Doudnabacteria bacterium]|nr:30S ribosomal protein S7 [Candidatus Doudnabacteria bacterium]